MQETTESSEMDVLKQRLKATWSAGDFSQIAKSYERGAAVFIENLGLQDGQKVLDVACGNGNLSFPAARSGATVHGIDIAPNLIAQANQRATEEGDAEQSATQDILEINYAHSLCIVIGKSLARKQG